MLVPLQQKRAIDLVETWINQNRAHGKNDEQMAGTTFIFGNEILSLHQTLDGRLEIESKTGPVVIFRNAQDLNQPNICRACGVEHESDKEAIECCMNIGD